MRSDRYPIAPGVWKFVLPLFVAATLAFFVGAGYAVFNGRSERRTNCEEIRELRNDIISALEILTSHPDSSRVKEAKETISAPSCDIK